MNDTDDFDQLLARQLKNSQPYIADDGFCAKVLAELPASRISRTKERCVIGTTVLLIALLVGVQLSVMETVSQLWQWVYTADLMTLFRAGAGVFVAMLLICAGWLAREMRLV